MREKGRRRVREKGGRRACGRGSVPVRGKGCRRGRRAGERAIREPRHRPMVREVAATVVFLASPAAGYITGKIIEVDGGIERAPTSTLAFPTLSNQKT